MRYIKRVLHNLALLLVGALFGCGVCAGVQWLIQQIRAGTETVQHLMCLPVALLIAALTLAALEKEDAR